MANDLQQVINEIRILVTSNDLTNTPQNLSLAKQYVEYCKNFNSKIAECEVLLDRKMIIEAEALAENESPTLREQSLLLEFKEKADFLELFEMYDWEIPPRLRLDVLEQLDEATASQKNTMPLIVAYRKVMRSDDLNARIYLLRKLVKAEPQSAEWAEALTSLEKQLFDRLANQAKNAILNKQYDELTSIKKALVNPDWYITLNPAVLAKIEQVLDSYNQENLHKMAVEFLEKINEAYSCYDDSALERMLKKWHYLVDEEGYKANESELMQVSEAEDYFNSQKAEMQSRENFDKLLKALQNGLVADMDINKLEHIYTQLKLTEYPIPENVEQRYFAYKESAEDVMRRKRTLRIVISCASVVAFFALVGWITYFYIMRSSELQWAEHIERVLKEKKSSEAFELLDKLEKSSPTLRKRATILALEAKAKEKKEAEQKAREAFKIQANQIRNDFKSYDVDKSNLIPQQLAKIQQYIVDGQEENVFLELKKEFNFIHANFVKKQNEQFLRNIDKMQDFRKKYFVALTDERYDAAADQLKTLENLSQVTQNIQYVTQENMAEQKSFFDEIVSFREKLRKDKAQYDKREEIAELIRSSQTVDEMGKHLNTLFQEVRDDSKVQQYWKLKNNLANVARFCSPDPKNIPADNVFKRDYQEHLNNLSAAQNLRDQILKMFGNFERIYFGDKEKKKIGNMIYVLTLKNSNGVLLDFYYDNSGRKTLQESFSVWSKIGDGSYNKYSTNTPVKFLIAENGLALNGFISYKVPINGNASEIECTVKINNVPYTGKMIYPVGLKHKWELPEEELRAPHANFIRNMLIELRNLPVENFEVALIAEYKKLIKQQNITPALRLFMGRMIMESLVKHFPYNKSYSQTCSTIRSIEKSIPAQYHWMQSYRENSIQLRLKSKVEQLAANVFKESIEQDFYTDLYSIVFERKIIPAGYVTRDKSVLRLNGFVSHESGELWMPSSKAPYWSVIGTFANGVITVPEKVATQLADMQILYTVKDQSETKTLVEKIRKMAKKVPGEQIKWPDCWPVIAKEK